MNHLFPRYFSIITNLDFLLIHVYMVWSSSLKDLDRKTLVYFWRILSPNWERNDYVSFWKNIYSGLYNYWKYGIPSLVIVCLEWWWIEFLSIIAGWLSEKELAANVALLNLNYVVYNFPLGMSYSIWAMVGNALGSNLPKRAVRIVKTSMMLAFIIWFLTIIIFLIFKAQFAAIFTKEESVVEVIYQLIPIYWLVVIVDFIQGVQGGIIRGMGYQNFATIIIIISYWIIAIPTAYYLAFIKGMRIAGVWLGLPTGSILILSSFTLILVFTKWKRLAHKIHFRKE